MDQGDEPGPLRPRLITEESSLAVPDQSLALYQRESADELITEARVGELAKRGIRPGLAQTCCYGGIVGALKFALLWGTGELLPETQTRAKAPVHAPKQGFQAGGFGASAKEVLATTTEIVANLRAHWRMSLSHGWSPDYLLIEEISLHSILALEDEAFLHGEIYAKVPIVPILTSVPIATASDPLPELETSTATPKRFANLAQSVRRVLPMSRL